MSFKHYCNIFCFLIGIKIYREQSQKAKDVWGGGPKKTKIEEAKRAPGFYHSDHVPVSKSFAVVNTDHCGIHELLFEYKFTLIEV